MAHRMRDEARCGFHDRVTLQSNPAANPRNRTHHVVGSIDRHAMPPRHGDIEHGLRRDSPIHRGCAPAKNV